MHKYCAPTFPGTSSSKHADSVIGAMINDSLLNVFLDRDTNAQVAFSIPNRMKILDPERGYLNALRRQRICIDLSASSTVKRAIIFISFIT